MKQPTRQPNTNGLKQDNAAPVRTVSRGAAIRAQKRNAEMANKITNEYLDASAMKLERRANVIDDTPRLKIIGLGGMDGGGSKNMLVLEYLNDALVLDAGNDLGVDLPGINYGIADISYLETIKNKVRGYVISHGHLDHIGGLPHIMPKVPAPVYGSKFTIGRVEETFENFGLPMPNGFELKTIVMNDTTHERLKIGNFFIELVRVTHSIPGSTSVVIDTPVGRVVNTSRSMNMLTSVTSTRRSTRANWRVYRGTSTRDASRRDVRDQVPRRHGSRGRRRWADRRRWPT